MGFAPVPPQPDFPAMERVVLDRWAERKVFARSLERTADGPLFRFYEGPPTANGRPGVHHVEARVFKDVFPRYRTMKGYRVPRKGGWDCHGIPVEIAVERDLGFTRKQDIEDYGVAEFNARCRASVTAYVEDWTRLTERIGFWVDTGDAYWTMATPYVESVWWSLKQLFDAGMVYEGHRVVPYCPRCGTALSDHEVAQGYATTDDPSVYVRLPVLDGPLAEAGASLLVWTTTPWTLVSNTLAAVGPHVAYVLARSADDAFPVVLAAERVVAVLGDGAQVLRDVGLDELVGLRYQGPFDLVGPGSADGTPLVETWRTVVTADWVTTADGTGVVHLAPAFGADDFAVGRDAGVPVVNPVDLEGRFVEAAGPFAGVFVKDADPTIVEDLASRGLLLRSETYTHAYPFCWRCATPLIYYAKPSWYIATTRVRERLVEENAATDWRPPHVRDGRYGDWLENNVDWALSRERYWGTPLPLWRCEDCEEVTAVGSRAELGERAGRDLSELDPHRPYVDAVTVPCRTCDGTARRVPEVIDAWYDSGAVPFAQFGYPHAEGSEALLAERYPADFIAEAIDQTRGWFYSLHALGTLLFDATSYRRVLCLGHIVDADGRKMSKSLGNVLDPWGLIEQRGADALRWLLLTDGSPWVSRRVGHEPLAEVTRRFLLTLWNTAVFFTTYARLEGWEPTDAAPRVAERSVMDRWVLAELADTVATVDAGLDDFDATAAGRRLTTFVDDLSNWYVRRSRTRFWRTGADDGHHDAEAAFATLHECLVTVATLLAPFVPFLADELHERLVRDVDPGASDSVHLVDYPRPDEAARDDGLRQAMAGARRLVELGRRARSDAQTPVRQPLRAALVTLPSAAREDFAAVRDVVAEELNVHAVDTSDGDSLVTRTAKANFRALGPSFGKDTPAVARAIAVADGEALASALAADGEASVVFGDRSVTVTAEQVWVTEEPVTGWQVAAEGGWAVALDLTVDDDLRREGVARELVRTLNDLRKRQDLALDDRVDVRIVTDGLVADAVEQHRASIAADVLAVSLTVERRSPDADDGEQSTVAGVAAGVHLAPTSAAAR